jgi:hypothetical protein
MTGKCAAGGGSETTDGANTVCTFNTSGTLEVVVAGAAAVSAPPVQNVIFFDEAMLPRRVIIA